MFVMINKVIYTDFKAKMWKKLSMNDKWQSLAFLKPLMLANMCMSVICNIKYSDAVITIEALNLTLSLKYIILTQE